MDLNKGKMVLALIAAIGLCFTAFSLGLIMHHYTTPQPVIPTPAPTPPRPQREHEVIVRPGSTTVVIEEKRP